jgi:hypothetical protein
VCSPGDDPNLLLLETIFAALCCWLEATTGVKDSGLGLQSMLNS